MKKQRFTEVQICKALKVHALNARLADIIRRVDISEATFCNRGSKYGVLEAIEAKRPKKLLVGTLMEKAALKKVMSGM